MEVKETQHRISLLEYKGEGWLMWSQHTLLNNTRIHVDFVSHPSSPHLSSEGELGNGVSAMALATKAFIQRHWGLTVWVRLQPSEATNMQQTIAEGFTSMEALHWRQPTHIVCMTDPWLGCCLRDNQKSEQACLEAWVNRTTQIG